MLIVRDGPGGGPVEIIGATRGGQFMVWYGPGRQWVGPCANLLLDSLLVETGSRIRPGCSLEPCGSKGIVRDGPGAIALRYARFTTAHPRFSRIDVALRFKRATLRAVNEVERARPKPLPVLLGPPGHEHLPPLPAPPPEVDVRTRRARAVPRAVPAAARVVAEALFSPDGTMPDEARLAYIERDFGDFYARAQGSAGLILRASLFALMYLAPLMVFRPGSLRSLSLAQRARALERFEATPLAPAALAVKAMLCVIWFEHPTTQAETLTDPSCMKVRP